MKKAFIITLLATGLIGCQTPNGSFEISTQTTEALKQIDATIDKADALADKWDAIGQKYHATLPSGTFEYVDTNGLDLHIENGNTAHADVKLVNDKIEITANFTERKVTEFNGYKGLNTNPIIKLPTGHSMVINPQDSTFSGIVYESSTGDNQTIGVEGEFGGSFGHVTGTLNGITTDDTFGQFRASKVEEE